MSSVVSDFPFKVSSRTIVIIRDVPAYECDSCAEYLFADDVMECIDALLASTTGSGELTVIRYAA
jgi:YgiT-type zinc finger domain-containing protein